MNCVKMLRNLVQLRCTNANLNRTNHRIHFAFILFFVCKNPHVQTNRDNSIDCPNAYVGTIQYGRVRVIGPWLSKSQLNDDFCTKIKAIFFWN